jgi:hypothetical protein
MEKKGKEVGRQQIGTADSGGGVKLYAGVAGGGTLSSGQVSELSSAIAGYGNGIGSIADLGGPAAQLDYIDNELGRFNQGSLTAVDVVSTYSPTNLASAYWETAKSGEQASSLAGAIDTAADDVFFGMAPDIGPVFGQTAAYEMGTIPGHVIGGAVNVGLIWTGAGVPGALNFGLRGGNVAVQTGKVIIQGGAAAIEGGRKIIITAEAVQGMVAGLQVTWGAAGLVYMASNGGGGVYRPNQKHDQARPKVSPQPVNGPAALENSVPVTDKLRVAIEGEEFVLLRRESKGVWHGYRVGWSGLTDKAKAVLIKLGLVSQRGKICR